jgi:hypothetical protein
LLPEKRNPSEKTAGSQVDKKTVKRRPSSEQCFSNYQAEYQQKSEISARNNILRRVVLSLTMSRTRQVHLQGRGQQNFGESTNKTPSLSPVDVAQAREDAATSSANCLPFGDTSQLLKSSGDAGRGRMGSTGQEYSFEEAWSGDKTALDLIQILFSQAKCELPKASPLAEHSRKELSQGK